MRKVHDDGKVLNNERKLRINSFFSCVNSTGDIHAFTRKVGDGVEAIVGTPSRIFDMVQSHAIPVKALRFFVLDEAVRHFLSI